METLGHFSTLYLFPTKLKLSVHLATRIGQKLSVNHIIILQKFANNVSDTFSTATIRMFQSIFFLIWMKQLLTLMRNPL